MLFCMPKKNHRVLTKLIACSNIVLIGAVCAEENSSVTLPTFVIEGMEEEDPSRTYVDYKQANVTRNNLDKKEIPQTIDTIDVQKYKLYGSNDLSVMLQGTPGVATSYDMRGDGIMLRGFDANNGDIYRDGIRESGQVRRSTANVERIEILKGPASVLYGRSGGGGVINMVSKSANFESTSSIGAYAGSNDNHGVTLDANNIVSDHWAVRLTGEHGESGSFRDGIETDIDMISPSVTYDNDKNLKWTGQYTYDNLDRVPDRGPSYDSLPTGTSLDLGFAQPGDFVEDELQVVRSDLTYSMSDHWQLKWVASYREAYQNFDHFYSGTYCESESTVVRRGGSCEGHVGDISQVYYWQETSNSTLANNVSLLGDFVLGGLRHRLVFGVDMSLEEREPKLANTNQDGSEIYGYVNPLTGEKSSSRGTGALEINTHNYYDSINYGVFAQDLISLSPNVDLMLGIRFDEYESTAQNKLLDASDSDYERKISDSTFSPNIGVVWRPLSQHSVYSSYSRSYAPFGGRVSVNSVRANQDLDLFNAKPQYNDQYEIGIKSDWLNQRLVTQLAIFDIEKSNIRYRPDPENDPYYWALQGEQESKGVELSFTGQVAEKIFVRGGLGYNKAIVKEDKTTPENEGNSLSGVPRHTGNIFIRYLPTSNSYAEIGITHVGDIWTNSSNTSKLSGFNRVDTAIGYNVGNWRTSLAVTNLLDKEYWRSSSMPGTPRSILARLNYKFE